MSVRTVRASAVGFFACALLALACGRLKIQDAAYLGEGQSATLTGAKGKPASYKWVPGKIQDGILTVTYRGGKMSGAMPGKTLDDATLQKSVPIDTNIDIQGFPTQVSAGVGSGSVNDRP